MRYIVATALLIAAAIAPQAYQQGVLLYGLRENHPATLQRLRAPFRFELKLADQVRNCEDVLIDETSGWAMLSCNPSRDIWNTVMGYYTVHNQTEGALYLYDYANRYSDDQKLIKLKLLDFPPADNDFHPLGLEYHAPSQRIFVANLARSGSRVEVFKLHLAEEAATHIRSIRHVHLPSPNAIHAINENELYITNDHYFPHRQNEFLSLIESFGGLPISPIVHVDISGEKVEVTAVARHPFPNGIARLNDTTYAVASTSTGSVRLYDVDPATKKWVHKGSIELPMLLPDNLSVDGEGTLFITGHSHMGQLAKRSKTRIECNSPAGRGSQKCRDTESPSHVVSWTQRDGVKDIWRDTQLNSAATAVRDSEKKVGLITPLYDHGILMWTE